MKNKHADAIPAPEDIAVRLIPTSQITLAACYSHMGKRQKEGIHGCDETRAPLEIKDRWTVNYARHSLTPYDQLVRQHPENQPQIKINVLDAIAKTYPKLRTECERQKHEVEKETANEQ